jgi:prephenate dehydrogenase
MARIAIIGLGLIGGSLGLALKRANIADLEIAGYDEQGTGRARKLGAIDREARSAAKAVEGAALTIIAVPISQVRSVLEEIAPALAEGAVVTDTASTKREVIAWADELLPETVSFVGGHPIAGKEVAGIDAAEAELFQGRAWAVIPSVRASERAISAVENLVALVGARAVIVDAAEHDSYLAAVSHLPLLLSTALFSLASSSSAWPELASLSGPGFRDVTRLASTPPELSHDIVLTNRENVLHWLDRLAEELRRFRKLVEDGAQQEELFKALATVQSTRDAFLRELPVRETGTGAADMLSAGERITAFLMGEFAVRRTKEIQEMIEKGERPSAEGPRREDRRP